MYKVIRLNATNKENSPNTAVHIKYKVEDAEDIKDLIEVIDSIYTTAKLSDYMIIVDKYMSQDTIPRIVMKFIGDKTIIVNLFIDNNFVLEDILLAYPDDEQIYIYNRAKNDNLLDEKTIEDFNKLSVSLKEKLSAIMTLL